MNEHPKEEDRLERLLAGAVHELAPRRAPHTLESRVLEELARRAALPWWRRSFGHWPALARAGLVVTCGALAASLTGALGNLAALLANTILPTWLLLGLSAAALLYAFLFGLGAAAYRLLYLQPLNGG